MLVLCCARLLLLKDRDQVGSRVDLFVHCPAKLCNKIQTSTYSSLSTCSITFLTEKKIKKKLCIVDNNLNQSRNQADILIKQAKYTNTCIQTIK